MVLNNRSMILFCMFELLPVLIDSTPLRKNKVKFSVNSLKQEQTTLPKLTWALDLSWNYINLQHLVSYENFHQEHPFLWYYFMLQTLSSAINDMNNIMSFY